MDAIIRSLGMSSRRKNIPSPSYGLSWGDGKSYCLGTGYTTEQLFPYIQGILDLSDMVEIVSGGNSGMARLKNNDVYSWGNDSYGQQGQGIGGEEVLGGHKEIIPRQIVGLKATKLASIGATCAALLPNREVVTWGGNIQGELGNGYWGEGKTPENENQYTEKEWEEKLAHFKGQFSPGLVQTAGPPQSIYAPKLQNVIDIACGKSVVMYLLGTGEIFFSGLPQGQHPNHYYAAQDLRTVNIHEAVEISASEESAICRLKNGEVRTWGRNTFGQLGNGEEAQGSMTVGHPEFPEKVKQVSIGENFCLALLEGGEVYSWGRNGVGQLGNGEFKQTGYPLPVPIPGLKEVKQIWTAGEPKFGSTTLGQECAIARLEDGSIRTWGGNEEGQCADLTLFNKSKPVEPPEKPKHITSVCAGASHMYVIQSPGTPGVPSLEVIPESGGKLKVKWKAMTGLAGPRIETSWNVEWQRWQFKPGGKREKGVGSGTIKTNTDPKNLNYEYNITIPKTEPWPNALQVYEVTVKGNAPVDKPKDETIHQNGEEVEVKVNTSTLLTEVPKLTCEHIVVGTKVKAIAGIIPVGTYVTNINAATKEVTLSVATEKTEKRKVVFEGSKIYTVNWKPTKSYVEKGYVEEGWIVSWHRSKQYTGPKGSAALEPGNHTIVLPGATRQYVIDLQPFETPPGPKDGSKPSIPAMLEGYEWEELNIQISGIYSGGFQNRATLAEPIWP